MRAEKETPRRRVGWALLLALGLLVVALDGVLAPPPQQVRVAITRPIPGGRPRVQPAGMARLARAAQAPAISGPSVVHVWLQGCGDCAPAFAAAKALRAQGATFGAPVFNVSAFNDADPAYALEHGVDERLLTDRGEFVGPLGIGTFTTLVLDAQGFVRHTDYPQTDGYLQRVRAAVAEAATPLAPTTVEAEPMPLTPTISTTPGSSHALMALGAALALAGLGWGALLVPWAALLRRARPAPPAPERVLGQEVGLQPQQRCPYCHADLTDWDWVVRCGGCATVYHEECASDLSKCTSLGCARPVSGRRAPER